MGGSVMIALLLAEGFEEVEAVTTADFLNRAGIDVKLAGVGGTLIKGAHEITVKADMEIESLTDDIEGIILPGGMPGSRNLAKSGKVISLIKSLNKQKKLICAICAAPAVVLLRAGVIGGKKVTSYPGYEDEFTDSHYMEKNVVADGNIITSRGPGTAPYFAFKIIETLKGKEAAQKVQQAVLL
jgi:protein deglycase